MSVRATQHSPSNLFLAQPFEEESDAEFKALASKVHTPVDSADISQPIQVQGVSSENLSAWKTFKVSGIVHLCNQSATPHEQLTVDRIQKIANSASILCTEDEARAAEKELSSQAARKEQAQDLPIDDSQFSAQNLPAWKEFKFAGICYSCRLKDNPREGLSVEQVKEIAKELNLSFSEKEYAFIQQVYRNPPRNVYLSSSKDQKDLKWARLKASIKHDIERSVPVNLPRLRQHAQEINLPLSREFFVKAYNCHEQEVNELIIKLLKMENPNLKTITSDKVHEAAIRVGIILSEARALALYACTRG